jgi:hypothetical protein
MRYLHGFKLDSAAIRLDQPNRLLAEGLAARRLHVLDVLPAFRAAHSSGVRLFGEIDPHLTPEGNQLLARLVTPAAAALLRDHP